ncbi:hypothetical protein L249_5535, partial [Ophiocordyceps polyrhachis-furcata BCC 54312]
LPEPESLAKEYFWSLPIVAERGNFFKKKKKKRNHKVRKADADDSSNTLTYLYVRTLPRF